ncbi:MAG: hypothetical protein J6Z43_07175 [Clostridiales bacterium]|nr:hypothetical protein [Clostridiales bacterium]
MRSEPEVDSDKKMIDKITGKVELNHVFFKYEEKAPYVLNDMSFKIKQGEYVAIVIAHRLSTIRNVDRIMMLDG